MIDKDNFFEVLDNRRTVRDFVPYEITDSEIERIIDSARLAPSAVNAQNWKFLAIVNQDVKEKMARLGNFTVEKAQSTIYITPNTENEPMDDAFKAAKQVFGIASVCRAAWVEKTIEDIESTLPEYLAPVLGDSAIKT